jgi:hypothetical protein
MNMNTIRTDRLTRDKTMNTNMYYMLSSNEVYMYPFLRL